MMGVFRLAGLLLAICLGWVGWQVHAGEDPETWPIGGLVFDAPVPDLRFLNHKPAGKHGRVVRAGADLAFEDGTPARFWGANLQAYALFHTEQANVSAQARRIAALGFNLVRIHHHDSVWVKPNVFGTKPKSTRRLDPEAMARLDQWIAALKAEGVYIWLDLHVGRKVTASDGVEAFAEIAKDEATAGLKGFNYVSPGIQDLMLEFQDAYLGHINSVTGLSYAEDPTVIAVLITNENDLTRHYGNALLPDKKVPHHSARYMALAEDFAREHGLSRRATWRSWEYGPSKIFLGDLERRFNERMITGIRRTGYRGLVATTNLWGYNALASLPSLTNGSIIDAHAYGREGEIRFDPREDPGYLDWLAIAQVAGWPVSISEWNVSEFPVADRFTAPVRMATMAAHQGWDAPMIYGYAQQPLNGPLRPSNWDVAYDPALMGLMPAAALLYRRGDVQPAEKTYALCLDDDAFFGREISPKTSVAIRTLVEQSRLVVCIPPTPALPWLEPAGPAVGQIPVTDPDTSFLAQGATEIVADTGDFRRDFRRGRVLVDTPRSQIVAGAFAGEPVALADVEVRISNPMAAVAVQSLDELPISGSGRILVSIMARAVPLGAKKTGYRVEPLKGNLRIRARPDLTLRGLSADAGLAPGAHRIEAGIHVIDLGKTGGAGWLVLE